MTRTQLALLLLFQMRARVILRLREIYAPFLFPARAEKAKNATLRHACCATHAAQMVAEITLLLFARCHARAAVVTIAPAAMLINYFLLLPFERHSTRMPRLLAFDVLLLLR